jgi:hypothetical protein
MNSTIPQPYKPAEQGTFEASLGGIEDMINPLMELDWVRPYTFTKHRAQRNFKLSLLNANIDITQELWDNHFHNNIAGSPPDLWNFDAGTFTFPDNNENVMEWDR